MVKPYLNQVNGKVDTDTSLFTGGINTYQDKAFIEENQLAYSMNMTMYKPPMLCTRASREHVANIDLLSNKSIVGMWAYNDNWFIAVSIDKSDSTDTASISWFNIRDGSMTPLENQLPWSTTYNFCYCRKETEEYLYITTDTAKLKLTINSSGVLGEEPIVDNHYGKVAFHKGRLFFANSKTNRIAFSALWDFDNFMELPSFENPKKLETDLELVNGTTPTPQGTLLPTGTYITTEDYSVTLDGEIIVSENVVFHYDANKFELTFQTTGDKLKYEDSGDQTNYVWETKGYDYSSYAGEFFVTNSRGAITNIASFDDKLVIFCEHSMHAVYGSSPLVGSQYMFQLVDINNNLGCVASKTIAIGGGNLFWLGDDNEIYKYSGSSIDMISRPNRNRYVMRMGGISNIPLDSTQWSIGVDNYVEMCATATSDKYYITLSLDYQPSEVGSEKVAHPIFVFDIYNAIWWAEDGALSAISNISFGRNNVLMARNKEVFKTTDNYSGVDHIFNSENVVEDIPIEYEFHTKVYGASIPDSRKTISKVYFQAVAEAKIYLTDTWTDTDFFVEPYLQNTLRQIGTLEKKGRDTKNRTEPLYNSVYEDTMYESQVCYVEKLFGQRLNTFQIVIRGTGSSKYYLIKKEWRVS